MEALQASEARRFGKYTLVAKLATGGMAEIFLARLNGDGGFEKLVCIKRILPHLAKDPQFVAMFLDEARVAARISHPNVCQVFELGEWEKQYYIAMEYLEGVPLAVFRRTDFYPQPPDVRLVAGFGVQACEGLHHAHQLRRSDGETLGVVHRDITPQNLFATTDGIVKVLDFGIAKVHDASVRTSTGAVKGTYAYMSPEQLRNEKLDRRCDVWALGVVLWETLAQQHLFKRDTEFLTFEAITKEPIPSICDVRPDVSPLLGDTISRALSRNPADRFPSARALGEALAQAVAPLGGAMSASAISDEVAESFQVALAEQRTLLNFAREGGQFDLETSSPLVGHGTRMTTTPVSNIQRKVQEAQEEVAHYVAAQQAVDSLFDQEVTSHPGRMRTDGAFTPVPSRIDNRPMSASGLDSNIAELSAGSVRYSQSYMAAPPPSRLPWIIALIAVAVASTTGVLLYVKLSAKPAATTAAAGQQPAIVMNEGSSAVTPTPAPVPAPPPNVAPAPTALPPPPPAAATEPPAEAAEVKKVTAPPPNADKASEKTAVKTVDKTPDKSAGDKNEKKRPPANLEETKVEPKAELKAPPPAAGPPGLITIDSAPVYAVIYVDGKKIGETPLVNIKLPAGKHAVRAVSPSGATKNLTITIEAGKTAPVRKISW